MKKQFFVQNASMLFVVVAIVFGATSWQQRPVTPALLARDTLPAHPAVDVDAAMATLDAAELQLSQLKLADVQRQLQKEQANLAAQMKDLEAGQQRIAEMDIEKLKKQLEATARVDWKKTEQESAANMRAAKEQMMAAQQQLENAAKNLDKDWGAAQAELQKSKAELAAYEQFISGLKKDGIIKNNDYRVEEKAGVLYINGNAQADAVYQKYRAFLQQHKGLRIEKKVGEPQVEPQN